MKTCVQMIANGNQRTQRIEFKNLDKEKVMNGRVSYLRIIIVFLALLLAAPLLAPAQSSGAGPTFRQEELDQMLAPIALYPDSLLGQILVAATFPNEVEEADQWVNQHENLKEDELNAALDDKDWDLSVKALVPFPKVLSMMSDKREWTQRLGDAFLAQQAAVMDTVQNLRSKAHAQGNLKNTDQQRVVVRGRSIEIVPSNPRIIYVPTYNPTVIYGSWWHPEYPPYGYNPYYPHYAYDPYYTGTSFVSVGLFGFAAGVGVGSVWNSGWGHWDWGRRNVNVNINRTININRNDIVTRNIRTTSVNRVVTQRRAGATGRAVARTSGERASRARPTADSVQKGLQQRESNARGRQGSKAVVQDRRTRGTERAQRRDESSGRSGDQVRRATSSGRSAARMERAQASGRSGARMERAQASGRSRGDSVRNAGSSRRGGEGNRGGGKARGGGGGHGGGKDGGKSHDKRE